jgi:hypothetical protein
MAKSLGLSQSIATHGRVQVEGAAGLDDRSGFECWSPSGASGTDLSRDP